MATYYITPSPIGNDSTGDGSIGLPWATVEHATATVTSSGDTIYINAGTYTVSAQPYVERGVSIIGAGKDVVTINCNHAGGILEMWSAAIDNQPSVTVSGITFNGQNLGYNAVSITRRCNVTVDNCNFINFVSGACYAYDGYDSLANSPAIYNINVTNCEFTDCTRYLAAGSFGMIWHRGVKDYVITNNTVTANYLTGDTAGFLVKGSRNQNVRISGNTLSVIGHNDGTKWAFAIEYNHVLGGIQIDNNTIQGVLDFAGNHCQKGLYDYSLWIHHNTLGHESLSTRYQDCIYLENYSLNSSMDMSDVIIEDNTIKNITKGVGFMKVATNNQSHFNRINIRRNTMTNIGIINAGGLGWGITWNGDGGVFENIYIYNNTIIATTEAGTNPLVGISLPVRNSATTNYRIINNIIQGFDNAPIFTDGSYLTGTIDQLYIQNNDMYQNGNSNNPKWWGVVPTNMLITSNLKVDPLFVSSSNFNLQSSSLLRNAGLDVGLPYSGVAPDMGALEYNESTTTTTTTSSIPPTTTTTTTTVLPTTTTTSTTILPTTTTTTSTRRNGTSIITKIKRKISLRDPDYFCDRSWTLSFNMNIKSWVSFHSYIPNWYMGENNFFYSGVNNCCSEFDFIAGTLIPTPPTTTTTTTLGTTTTTTSTTMIPLDCTLEGYTHVHECYLDGKATFISQEIPPCERPVGLSIFSLITGYLTEDPWAEVVSTGSLETACAALSLYPMYEVTSIEGWAFSISIGNQVYADDNTEDCTCVPNGWYFTDETAFYGNIIHIVDCIIVEITNCTPTTTTTSTTAAPTTTTTTTSTTAIPVNCDTIVNQNDAPAYPFYQEVNLGATTGTVTLTFDAVDIPDRIIVRWNGNVVIDTKYRGKTGFDVGEITRNLFTASLTGKIDPISGFTYPDFVTYPTDGYPEVDSPGNYNDSFNKSAATPNEAYVEVYAPMDGTIWEFILGCPVSTSTTTTSTSTTGIPASTTTTTTTISPCVDCEPYFGTTTTTTTL